MLAGVYNFFSELVSRAWSLIVQDAGGRQLPLPVHLIQVLKPQVRVVAHVAPLL